MASQCGAGDAAVGAAAPAPAVLPEVVVIKPLVEQILGQESEHVGAVQRVYLVTISRVQAAVLPDGRQYQDLRTLSRQNIGEALRDSFDNPVSAGLGGRPRRQQVEGQQNDSRRVRCRCFLEFHADGSVHFHAVVKLARNFRFGAAKRTLQERHSLPSHWSCTHSQVWSAMRYLYIGTPTKPEVDQEPWQWAADGSALDLFALSQEPFKADTWRKRREAKDKRASQDADSQAPKRARAAFTKLDLTALIISKKLFSRDSLLSYVQQHGTAAAQVYVNRNQRRLDMEIEDAQEWALAQERAVAERVSDWELLLQRAQQVCPHQAVGCSYKVALREVLERNRATLNGDELAAALRDVLVNGPSKTTRVPFLVGPSNTGKSTILYPFDDVFTPAQVLHKPALGSSFALRNLVGGK